jgi:hypothetical protein
MARAAVTIVLSLTTLLGPWLCCCTAAQVSAWFRPVPPHTEAPPPAPPADCCCCCCEQSTPAAAVPEVIAPAATYRFSPPAGACHCQETRPPAVSAAWFQGLGELDLVWAFAVPPAVPTLPHSPTEAVADGWPVWNASTRNLLDTSHMLRC